jgi:uncharacterized protein YcgL (UPF0745 family)
MADATNTIIYRSDTKPGLYIYLEDKKEISDLPEDLIKILGKHTRIMDLDLSQRDKLAQEDIAKVKENLRSQGYHVQFPNDFVKGVLKYGQ